MKTYRPLPTDDALIPQPVAALLLGLTAQAMLYVSRTRRLKRVRRKPIMYRLHDVLALRENRMGKRKTGRPASVESLERWLNGHDVVIPGRGMGRRLVQPPADLAAPVCGSVRLLRRARRNSADLLASAEDRHARHEGTTPPQATPEPDAGRRQTPTPGVATPEIAR